MQCQGQMGFAEPELSLWQSPKISSETNLQLWAGYSHAPLSWQSRAFQTHSSIASMDSVLNLCQENTELGFYWVAQNHLDFISLIAQKCQ